jgi:hypothetical protein
VSCVDSPIRLADYLQVTDRTLPTASDEHEEGRPASEPEPEANYDKTLGGTHIQSHSWAMIVAEKQACTEEVLQAPETQRQVDDTQRSERNITIKSEWNAIGFNDYESDDLQENVHHRISSRSSL